MNLNHANLCSTDIAGLANFFVSFFGFRLQAMRGRDAFAVLEGSDGFALNLMKPGKDGPTTYPDGFHVGFFVEHPDIVRAKHAEIAVAGLTPGDIQELTRGGIALVTFYCTAPGGVLVEVAAQHR